MVRSVGHHSGYRLLADVLYQNYHDNTLVACASIFAGKFIPGSEEFQIGQGFN